jgi:hypothetical protein
MDLTKQQALAISAMTVLCIAFTFHDERETVKALLRGAIPSLVGTRFDALRAAANDLVEASTPVSWGFAMSAACVALMPWHRAKLHQLVAG